MTPTRRRRVSLALSATCVALAGGFVAAPAHAQQTTVLVDTAIPDNFDRGRNVSVLERPHPDYDPLDIRYAGFEIAPQVETGIGASSNVYLTTAQQKGDGYVYVAPSITANSNFATSQVSLSAVGLGRRYFSVPSRNQTSYDLRALVSKTVDSYFTFTGEAQYAKLYETPDSGAIDPSLAVLSTYRRSYFNLRGQYSSGRARVIVAADRIGLTFDDITLENNRVDQTGRDRVATRVTTEVQYALSPSFSLYSQGSADRTEYSEPLAGGIANRDSTGWRLVGGANFDLAGLMRGKIGLGYIRRNYSSPLYADVGGLSVEASLEYFLTQLTTIGLRAGRTLEDTSVSNSGAFFSDRFQLRVDHELLQNLIISGQAQYIHQDYVKSKLTNDYYGGTATARYLVSRFITLNGAATYSRRTANSATSGDFDEFRAQFGVTYRR